MLGLYPLCRPRRARCISPLGTTQTYEKVQAVRSAVGVYSQKLANIIAPAVGSVDFRYSVGENSTVERGLLSFAIGRLAEVRTPWRLAVTLSTHSGYCAPWMPGTGYKVVLIVASIMQKRHNAPCKERPSRSVGGCRLHRGGRPG